MINNISLKNERSQGVPLESLAAGQLDPVGKN